MDVSSLILTVMTLGIALLIWYPFHRLGDRLANRVWDESLKGIFGKAAVPWWLRSPDWSDDEDH